MRLRVIFYCLLLSVLASTLALAQRKGSVRQAVVRVTPTNWHGQCPHTFQFAGRLNAGAPGTVYYTWVQSDGESSPRQSTTFGAAGQSHELHHQWTPKPALGTHGALYHGWVRLDVEGGPHSAPARFELQCRK